MAASKNYAARSIAALEATNATLRAEVSSQAAHIAMLEEKLLTMSVELASSRAREDEQNLMFRRQQQLSSSQVTIMSEDSERSLGSGVSGLIGNIFNNLDRSERSEGRRSSTMSDTDYSQESSSRRISMVGSLFRSRKSELTDDTVEEASCEYEEEQNEEKEEEEDHQPSSPQPQRRRPNRSLLANRRKSSRLISSTVAFPSLDDNDSLGFTVDSSKFE